MLEVVREFKEFREGRDIKEVREVRELYSASLNSPYKRLRACYLPNFFNALAYCSALLLCSLKVRAMEHSDKAPSQEGVRGWVPPRHCVSNDIILRLLFA